MSQYRYMIDFDGVLADLQGAFVRGCNAQFGTNYTIGEIDHWNWWDKQPAKFSRYVWKELFPDPDWMLEEVQPYPGAIDALADLLTNLDGIVSDEPWTYSRGEPGVAYGPPVQVITARKDPMVPMVKPWLEKHLPGGVEVYVFGMGSEGYAKATHCGIRRLNVVVEDNADTLRKFNSYSTSLFLLNRPWNQHEIVAQIERVEGLQDVVEQMLERAAA